jgi:hypothetical protein
MTSISSKRSNFPTGAPERLAALEMWAAELVQWAATLADRVAFLEARLLPENPLADLARLQLVASHVLTPQALIREGFPPSAIVPVQLLPAVPLESDDPKGAEKALERSAAEALHIVLRR